MARLTPKPSTSSPGLAVTTTRSPVGLTLIMMVLITRSLSMMTSSTLTGDDVIFAGSGDDTVFGQDNADTVWGGDGNDVLDGGHNFDNLNGEAGNDILRVTTVTTPCGGDGDDDSTAGPVTTP